MNPAAPTQPVDPIPRVASAAPAALPPAQHTQVETTGSSAPSARVLHPAPRAEPAPAQRAESQSPPLQSATRAEERPQPALKKPQPRKRAKAKPRRREPEGEIDSSFERRTVERSYDWLDRQRNLEPRGSRGHRFADRGDGYDDESSRRRRVIVNERGSQDFFGQLFRF